MSAIFTLRYYKYFFNVTLDFGCGKNNKIRVVNCRVPNPCILNTNRKDANWNLEKKSGEYSSSFFESKTYPDLNFFGQIESIVIKYSDKEENIAIKDIGVSFTVPPEALSSNEEPLTFSVAPAVGGNIETPPDCHSHSPLYMISPCSLAKEVKVTVDHTCSIDSEEDCKNMVILVPADLATAQKTGIYKLKEAQVEREFNVGSQIAAIKMKTLQPFRVAKKLHPLAQGKNQCKLLLLSWCSFLLFFVNWFLYVILKIASKSLYTVRVYKKDYHPSTPGDTIVFSISKLHSTFLKVHIFKYVKLTNLV